MSRDLLSDWFGVAVSDWPPDHYRLLGLAPGESNLALIEQRVHQRLDEVRRYQVAHPEPATEAMNRLAQAFVCLTDSLKKKAYDDALLPPAARSPVVEPSRGVPPIPSRPSPARVGPLPAGPEPLREEPFQFLYDPNALGPGGIPLPPVRVPAETPVVAPGILATTGVAEVGPETGAAVEVLPPPPLPPEPPPPPRVPVEEFRRAAQDAPAVRRGLSTLRAVFQRMTLTRQLLVSWEALAVYLEDPQRPLTRAEAVEMYRRIERIEDDLADFPLLGESGQPGYMILSLTRLNKSRNIVNLDATQRDSLARDWMAVRAFLEAHLEFLRLRSKEVRDQGWVQGGMAAARALLNEQPLAALVVLGVLLALGIAVWRQVF